MFKSKKILLIWTIILGWSVMTVAMDGCKAAPGSRTRGIPKRSRSKDTAAATAAAMGGGGSAGVVEPDTTGVAPALDPCDLAAIGAALKKERKRDRGKAYYAANKAKIKAYNDANKAKIQAYLKDYRAAHREEIKAYDKDYRAAHSAETKAGAGSAGAAHIASVQLRLNNQELEKCLKVKRCY